MWGHVLTVVTLLAVAAGEARGYGQGLGTEFTLPNGLRVRLVPAKGDKDVVVILAVRAGFFAEPAGKPHLAHVAEHLVVFGDRPGADGARATERWFAAGRANGETVGPMIYFDLRVPPEELGMALKVQAARLARPEFTRERLDREVPRTLKEVENLDGSDEGYTSKFAAMAFVQAAFHGQPKVSIKEKTRAYTPEEVGAFWTGAASPDRAILCVLGAFDPEAIRKQIEAEFGAIPRAAKRAESRPALKPGRIDTAWDLRARHVLLAWPTPPASDPDHSALTVAAMILTWRTFYSDNDPTAPTASPIVDNDVDGVFLLSAYVRPGSDVEAVESMLLDRVARLSGAGAPAPFEVRQAKARIGQTLGADADAVDLPVGINRSLVRANVELQRLMKELSWGDPAAYKARLDKVDRQAVIDAAKRYLDPGKATIVQLGPK